LERNLFALLIGAPGRRTNSEVKVLCRPVTGNCRPDGKGVHRKVESEGSRRQNAGLTNRNRIRGDHAG
jgi:hypothetical protein